MDNEFKQRLKELGFPLFEIESNRDPNITLADVVKSKDMRLWEGFPVMLANTANKELLNYEVIKKYLATQKETGNLDLLISVSLALYNESNINFEWTDKLYARLTNKEKIKSFKQALENGKDIRISQYTISSQRLKFNFNNYFSIEQRKFKDLLTMQYEHSYEYALVQIFSPRQKEIFKKKLKGEKLSKTEKEYFSRTIKKKLIALANEDLHKSAEKMLLH